ncbi:recombinase family protein [Streptosporangium sp. NPDC051022]|uniref:recombinase family protein n=1 Tax=Streptosporangium sp. NPDC051022 TaxID=3155752 RepID=UPI00344456AC
MATTLRAWSSRSGVTVQSAAPTSAATAIAWTLKALTFSSETLTSGPATPSSSPACRAPPAHCAHLLDLAAQLREREVDLLVLKQGIDTSTPSGRLQFHMFGAFDEFLREFIGEGTLEGLASARVCGRVGGRPPALDAHGVETARALYEMKGDDGKRRYTVQQIAGRLGVSRATID